MTNDQKKTMNSFIGLYIKFNEVFTLQRTDNLFKYILNRDDNIKINKISVKLKIKGEGYIVGIDVKNNILKVMFDKYIELNSGYMIDIRNDIFSIKINNKILNKLKKVK